MCRVGARAHGLRWWQVDREGIVRGSRIQVVVVLMLALAACASSDSEQSTTTSTEGATTTTSGDTTTIPAPTTTTTQATTTTTTSGSDSGGASCLVGDWELDSEGFMDSLTSAFAEEASVEGVTIEFVGGSYTVSLSEGGLFTGDREEWAFQISAPDGAFRVTIDGFDTGQWATDGSTLTISDYESASVLEAQAVVNGELVDLPAGTVPMADNSAVQETSTYECSGDVLTVTADEEFVSRFTRVGS